MTVTDLAGAVKEAAKDHRPPAVLVVHDDEASSRASAMWLCEYVTRGPGSPFAILTDWAQPSVPSRACPVYLPEGTGLIVLVPTTHTPSLSTSHFDLSTSHFDLVLVVDRSGAAVVKSRFSFLHPVRVPLVQAMREDRLKAVL